jgi:hypothetical protein
MAHGSSEQMRRWEASGFLQLIGQQPDGARAKPHPLLSYRAEVLMSTKTPCGAHTEVLSNNAVRVTRCTCGTLHLTLIANGVTVRLTGESFKKIAQSLMAAHDKLDEPVEYSATGSTSIN